MRKQASGTITEDPFGTADVGSSVHFSVLWTGDSDAGAVPLGVINWDFFAGALLGLLLKSAEGTSLIGSAALIAPGLALTATHNLDLDACAAGKVLPYCVGIRGGNVQIWKVEQFSFQPEDDTTVLSLTAASALPEDDTYYSFPLSAKMPALGETIKVVGFRDEGSQGVYEVPQLIAQVYAAAGVVTNVYPLGRDALLLPYPSIEIACGSLGGMSGGVALDARGYVIGVLSKGLHTLDGQGPSYVSWIASVLGRRLSANWPPGLYPPDFSLGELDPRLCAIEKPEPLG